MPKKSLCLIVPRRFGQQTIVLADSIKLRDKGFEVKKDANSIYVPLVHQPTDDEIGLFENEIPEVQVGTEIFRERWKQERTLEEALAEVLPPHLLASLPRSLDVVGDIAIVEIPSELKTAEKVVGEAILKTHRNVRTVLAKAGAVSGTYRVREFTFIAGEPRTRTVHRENGCQYHVDVAKAYFSPRLSYEHGRIESLVREGETVFDLFAGVGPFSILVAKKHPVAEVYAMEINPEAFAMLEKNVLLNRVQANVIPILGDARRIVHEKLSGVADRIIMNLPESAIEFVDVACEAVKSEGGMVHFYGFIRRPDPMETIKNRFSAEVKKTGRKVERFLSLRAVRETAPYEQQVVLDALVV